MKIFIIADASSEIGTGHVMRCLSLADVLNERGATVSFICRDMPGNLCSFIESKGFKVYLLSFYDECSYENNIHSIIDILKKYNSIHWLIIDNYKIDNRFEDIIRPYVRKIMVIDDMADRKHDCDLLLDQNLFHEMHQRYEHLVPENCYKLLGPSYALLRPEFRNIRNGHRRTKHGKIKQLLVSLGGSDPENVTYKVLEALKLLERKDIDTDVVVGASNPNRDLIRDFCEKHHGFKYHEQIKYMAQLMAEADLAIGGVGSTTWERCCLGLPSIVMVLSHDQENIVSVLEDDGLVINLGWHKEVSVSDIALKLNLLMNNTDILKEMALKSEKLVDGLGADRTANKIFEIAKL